MAKRRDTEPASLPVKEDEPLNRGTLGLLLAGVFLTSFSLLAFEITLARLLSVLLLYHFVFAVVSLALLGLGVGGIFVYFFRPQVPAGDNRFGSLALLASLISLAIPVSVILMIQIGYLDSVNNILVYGFLLFIPFFLAGVFLAEVFRMFPELSARIYGADLVGAAIGSLGVILLLNVLGGVNTSFLLGAIAAIAALLFTLRVLKKNIRRVMISGVSFLVVAGLLGTNVLVAYMSDIPIAGANPIKDIHRALYRPSFPGKIIETKWSAFGRTDLVEFSDRPELMEIYIDGTAGMPMYRFNGDFDLPDAAINRLKTGFTGYFPFFFLEEEEKNNALVIGPGGGRDILVALMGEVGQVTAVEVNKDLVDMVREYAWYNGGIYTDFENVTVIVDEGRNFLKRQEEKYDLIMLSLPVTQTSRSLEGYSLTENFLFTTESINDYLEHLTDEGRLVVVTHDDITLWKLISISLKALSQRGISNEAAFNQIYMLGLGSASEYPLFVLKKTPFGLAEVFQRHEKMRQLGYDPTLTYFPYIEGAGMVNPLLLALSRGKIVFNDVKRNMAEKLNLDISPATDNSPFFYKIDTGLPQPVSIVFWFSIIMMLLVLLVPPLYWKWRPARRETQPRSLRGANRLKPVVLFSMLGIGFMLVEISLIQKFILFLGQPVLSMAVLLFSLLVGAGLGSLFSGRLAPERITRGIAIASLSIVAVIVSYIFLLPLVFEQLLGLALAIRLSAMVVMLVPLGFLMGFPFPLGIRALKEMKMGGYIPWMWGINGVASVLGSVMTIALAIGFGFTQALLVGAACYLVVFLTFRKRGLKGV
jgi:predicted membrane-bound spermidine synthase